MIGPDEMKQMMIKVHTRELLSNVRKQRYMPQCLQRDIFMDVYNYLLVD